MVDEGGRGDTPSRHLAPSTLDGVVHEHMAAAVKLSLVAATQQHHLRPQNRGRSVPRHLNNFCHTSATPDQIRLDHIRSLLHDLDLSDRSDLSSII